MARALSSCTSRSPPRPLLRSGSARCAIWPLRCQRAWSPRRVVRTRSDSGAPLPARAADQQPRQLGVACDVTGFEHRQPGRDVLAGHLQRLRHGPHTVIEPNIGVPQRIPEQFGDRRTTRRACCRAPGSGRGPRTAPARRVPARRWRRWRTRCCGDADLGGLGGQPELVEITQCVTQGGANPVGAYRHRAIAHRCGQVAGALAGRCTSPPPTLPWEAPAAGSGVVFISSSPSSDLVTRGPETGRATSESLRVKGRRFHVHRCGPGPRCRRD